MWTHGTHSTELQVQENGTGMPALPTAVDVNEAHGQSFADSTR